MSVDPIVIVDLSWCSLTVISSMVVDTVVIFLNLKFLHLGAMGIDNSVIWRKGILENRKN